MMFQAKGLCVGPRLIISLILEPSCGYGGSSGFIVQRVQSVAVVCSSLSSLFLRFNPLKVLQPKRRLQQILASSPVPVPKPASGSGTAAPAATAPVAIPVPAPPAWDTLQLQYQRACSITVAVAQACTVATKTKRVLSLFIKQTCKNSLNMQFKELEHIELVSPRFIISSWQIPA